MKKRITMLLFALAALIAAAAPAVVKADSEADLGWEEGTPTKLVGEGTSTERIGEGGDLPAWYPVDPANFQMYHDFEAPRVVDNADLFTDEEEERLAELISDVAVLENKDLVIYTDVTSYGRSHQQWCADFYDFNGYGYSLDREGYCLFICMDPENRGFYTVGTGNESRELQTASNANQIDDELYGYMVDGDYFDGCCAWIVRVYTMYEKGYPFAPDWFPNRNEEFVWEADPSAPRAVDESETLSDEQLSEIGARAKEISDAYDIDVVAYVNLNTCQMSLQSFIEKFYTFNGYGFSDDRRGFIIGYSYYGDYEALSGGGDVFLEMSERQQERLTDKGDGKGAYDAIMLGLDDLEHYMKYGRVGRGMAYWIVRLVIEVIVGAAFGGIALSSARKKMETIVPAVSASRYLVDGTLVIDKVEDRFIRTTTTRQYSPRSSGSSSGGGSSHSSSFSSSSGSGHSGSGRSF